MKALWLFASVGLVCAAASPHAADVPCEQLIKQLDDALKASKISDVEWRRLSCFGTEPAKNARLRSRLPPIGIWTKH